MLFDV